MKQRKVGQTVYLLNTKDYYNRDNKITEPREAVLKSIGPKYYTVAPALDAPTWVQTKFEKEYPFRQKTEYAPDVMLFFSVDAAIKSQEKRILYQTIRSEISNRRYSTYSLDVLRRIRACLDEKIDEELDEELADSW